MTPSDVLDLRRELQGLPSHTDVTLSEQRISYLTTQSVIGDKAALAELTTAVHSLPDLKRGVARRNEITLLLAQAANDELERKVQDKLDAAKAIKQLHAEKYALYKQSSQRLLDDLRELLDIERRYGGLIPTPNWSATYERQLHLPAIIPQGHTGMTI